MTQVRILTGLSNKLKGICPHDVVRLSIPASHAGNPSSNLGEGITGKMEKRNWKVLVISLLVVYAAAFIGSIFTTGNTNSTWYTENKPSFTPSNFIFPIVWNILFLLIALSLYLAWINAEKKEKKKIAWIFAINLVLNALWSFLFFTMKNPFLAFIDLLLIFATIILMIWITGRISRKASWLLVPYLIWVAFAGILNFAFIIG